jgi:hypothetical protein
LVSILLALAWVLWLAPFGVYAWVHERTDSRPLATVGFVAAAAGYLAIAWYAAGRGHDAPCFGQTGQPC